jgi:hypothetical protein
LLALLKAAPRFCDVRAAIETGKLQKKMPLVLGAASSSLAGDFGARAMDTCDSRGIHIIFTWIMVRFIISIGNRRRVEMNSRRLGVGSSGFGSVRSNGRRTPVISEQSFEP